jgi:hypothetical protein
MNSTTSIRIIRTISLAFLLAVGLSVVGCDSGGSNRNGDDNESNDPLDATVTVEITGNSPQVSDPTIHVFYDLEDGSCEARAGGTGASTVPYDETVDPPEDPPDCPDSVSPGEYDGVQAKGTVNIVGGDDDLHVKILSDGDVIAEGTEPNDNDFWVAEHGFIPDS